jgi:hypothetical protein
MLAAARMVVVPATAVTPGAATAVVVAVTAVVVVTAAATAGDGHLSPSARMAVTGSRWKMLNRANSGIAIPIFLTALLAAVTAAGQQADPPVAAPDTVACAGDGPIVDGWRRPPTPAEVKAREASPDCQSQRRGAPGIDFSQEAGDKLDEIYRTLMGIHRSQNPDGGTPPATGQ